MTTLRDVIEVSKDLPQVGVVALSVFGVSLQAWIVILTAGWALFRLGIAALDFYERLEKRRKPNEQSIRD